MLQKMFNDILENYSYCSKYEDFTSHYFGDLFRKHIVGEIKGHIQCQDITIKGSVGQGVWATIPWIGVMNTEITQSTQRGIYVVYLFAENGTELYLTLNQGCTDIIGKLGKVGARDILKRRRDKIQEFIKIPEGFILSRNLDVGNSYYEDGSIIHKKYIKGSMPPDEILVDDLKKILDVYNQNVKQFIDLSNIILPTETKLIVKERNATTEPPLVEEFSRWLISKKYAAGHVPKIISAIENISDYAIHKGAADFDILKQENVLKLRDLISLLQHDEYFKQRNDSNSGKMLSTLKIYLRFLLYIEKKSESEREEGEHPTQKSWETEEIILLVALFYFNQVEYDGKQLKACAEWLSVNLNKRAQVLGEIYNEKYRNSKGTLMKLGNISCLDSDKMIGLKNYSKKDSEVFQLFHENPGEMFNMTARIISDYDLEPMTSIHTSNALVIRMPMYKKKPYIENWVTVHGALSFQDLSPTDFELNGRKYSTDSWSLLLYKTFYFLFISHNIEMRSMETDPLFPIAQESFFSYSNQDYKRPRKLPNGLYLELALTASEILNTIMLVLERCGLPEDYIKICLPQVEELSPSVKLNYKKPSTIDLPFLVANIIKEHKSGIELHEIHEAIPNIAKNKINGCLFSDIIVQINDKYYHKDNIDDLETAVIIIGNTLEKLFKQHNGYTSSKMLYDHCRHRLDEFFYYNSCFDSINEVYDLARHAFEKEKFEGKKYIFCEHFHIWEKEPEFPKTFFGLFIKWARENNGFIDRDTIIDKLTMIGAGNPPVSFSQNMKKDSGKYFMQYEEYKYVLTEEICIDAIFLDLLRKQIEILLNGEEYIPLGEISEYFYSMLPNLPFGINWTPLLLESVLSQHEEVGYTTIPAGCEYDTKTIDAAIVKRDSHYLRFSEIVWKTIDDIYGTPHEMSADEFRCLLVDRGFIRGSERQYTIHNTVESDLRFFWTEENKKVIVSKK